MMELITEKYFRILKIKKTTLLGILKDHQKKKHYMVGEVVPTEGVLKKVHTYDSAADKLLQDGMSDPGLEYLSSEKKLKLAGTLKKIDIETRKLQLGADALMLQAAKFLGGFIEKPKEGMLTAEEDVPELK